MSSSAFCLCAPYKQARILRAGYANGAGRVGLIKSKQRLHHLRLFVRIKVLSGWNRAIMRWSSFLTLLFLVFFCGKTLAAPVIEHGESEATLDKRQEPATTTTPDTASQETSTATTQTQATTATTTTSSDTTTSDTNHATHVATTVPSLDGSSTSGNSAQLNVTKPTYTGGLPIQPEITPALGVGGFILLVLGGALALIGIRKQWYVDWSGGSRTID